MSVNTGIKQENKDTFKRDLTVAGLSLAGISIVAIYLEKKSRNTKIFYGTLALGIFIAIIPSFSNNKSQKQTQL